MIEWILGNIVCTEFEKRVGKGNPRNDEGTTSAMHLGWSISPYCKEEQGDDGERAFQYKTIHMVICGPMNYVYVAIQEEVIDMDGNQTFAPLDVICYHDSCWRDAIKTFICRKSRTLSSLRASKDLFDWHDEIMLNGEEVGYLGKVDKWRTGFGTCKEPMPVELIEENPIQKRWIRG